MDNLADIEAKALHIAANATSIRADLSELAALTRRFSETRDIELDRLRKEAHDATVVNQAAQRELSAAKAAHNEELSTFQRTYDLKLTAMAVEVAKAIEHRDALQEQVRQIEASRSAMQKRLDEERQAHIDSGVIGQREIDRLQKLGHVLTDRHEWRVAGKEQSHGFEARILFECKGCPSVIVAPEDFLQWF